MWRRDCNGYWNWLQSATTITCDSQSGICTLKDMGMTATQIKGLFQLVFAPAFFSKPTPSFSEIAHNFLQGFLWEVKFSRLRFNPKGFNFSQIDLTIFEQ